MNTSNDNLLELVFYIAMSIALVILSLFFLCLVIVTLKDLFQNYKEIRTNEFIYVSWVLIMLCLVVLLPTLLCILKVAIKLEKDNIKKEKLEKHLNNIAIAMGTISVTGCIFLIIFSALTT